MSYNEHPHVLLGGSDIERDKMLSMLLPQIQADEMLSINLVGRKINIDASFSRVKNTTEEAVGLLQNLPELRNVAIRRLVHIEDASLFVGDKNDSFIKLHAWNALDRLLRLARSNNIVVVLSLPVSNFDRIASIDGFGYKMIAGSMEEPGGYGIPQKSVPYRPRVGAQWHTMPIGIGAGGRELSIDFIACPHTLLSGGAGSGKTLLTEVMLDHCIATGWSLYGIDLRGPHADIYPDDYAEHVHFATRLKDSVELLGTVRGIMEDRYAAMESRSVNNFSDLKDEEPVLLFVNEVYTLLAASGIKSEQGMEEDALKGTASKIIGDIARLGRAAGIHLLLVTQRPDATVIYGELKENLTNRIGVGKMDSLAAHMTFGSDEPRRHLAHAHLGRAYLQTFGIGEEFQMHLPARVML